MLIYNRHFARQSRVRDISLWLFQFPFDALQFNSTLINSIWVHSTRATQFYSAVCNMKMNRFDLANRIRERVLIQMQHSACGCNEVVIVLQCRVLLLVLWMWPQWGSATAPASVFHGSLLPLTCRTESFRSTRWQFTYIQHTVIQPT